MDMHIILLMTHCGNIRSPVHIADVIIGQASKQVHKVLQDKIWRAIIVSPRTIPRSEV